MANRRCLNTVLRHYPSILSSSSTSSLQHLQFLYPSLPIPTQTLPDLPTPHPSTTAPQSIFASFKSIWYTPSCHFSTSRPDDSEDDVDDDEEEDDDGDDGEEDYESDSPVNTGGLKREYTPEEKAAEAAAIGYKVIGPLPTTERVFKPYEPVFAVVQIGSHQFKVSNGDSIFTERLKFCDVNEMVILNKVLMLGTSSQTIIGRPILPNAAVHAVVEEHALDAKVIIFKKKRRKNYRRTKGHRQELTKLRIASIEGIEKPVKPGRVSTKKQVKVAVESPENIAVPA